MSEPPISFGAALLSNVTLPRTEIGSVQVEFVKNGG